ncbi:hypothetical protein POTOM_061596 [Populus tomentosa]|uniref:Uncharacterized protein n=1 Tax=Populus tomentosa TaxID=118781 RepID=A0A8X8BZL8_POPTO|nr:hypothetical protein POTOM_061596 [Populus tomentosa]
MKLALHAIIGVTKAAVLVKPTNHGEGTYISSSQTRTSVTASVFEFEQRQTTPSRKSSISVNGAQAALLITPSSACTDSVGGDQPPSHAVPSVGETSCFSGIGTDIRTIFTAPSASALQKAIGFGDLYNHTSLQPKQLLGCSLCLVEAWKALDTMVQEVFELTGYDRAMAYKFHDDDHGEVVSEVTKPGMEPLLGLHYPATDIPSGFTLLFMKNKVRMIVDCHARNMSSSSIAIHGQQGLELENQIVEKNIPPHPDTLCDMLMRECTIGYCDTEPEHYGSGKVDGAVLFYRNKIWRFEYRQLVWMQGTQGALALDCCRNSMGWCKDMNRGEKEDGRRMHPRSSFKAFLEVVKTRSLPWKDYEMDAIHSLQLILRNTFKDIETMDVDTQNNSCKAKRPQNEVDVDGLVNGVKIAKISELTGLLVDKAIGKHLLTLVEDSSVVYSQKNCYLGIAGFTARRWSMDKFTRIEGDYKAIVQNRNPLIPPIFGTDEFGWCSEWNPAMTNLDCWKREEVLDKMLLLGEVFGLNMACCRLKNQEAFVNPRSGGMPAVCAVRNWTERVQSLGYSDFLQLASQELQQALHVQRLSEQTALKRLKALAYLKKQIRNPLSGIIFSGKMMEGTELGAEQKELLHTSAQCQCQLSKILDDSDLDSIIEGGHVQ